MTALLASIDGLVVVGEADDLTSAIDVVIDRNPTSS
jgi:hypothetical protein